MKKLYTTITMVCLLLLTANSQTNSVMKELRKKVFELSQPMKLQTCDVEGTALNNCGSTKNQACTVEVDEGTQFKIHKVVSNNYVIRFLPWPDDDDKNSRLVLEKTTSSRLYFLIPSASFDDLAEERFSRANFVVGTVVLPVKMRFGSTDSVKINKEFSKKLLYDFSADVNLGLTLACKWNFRSNSKFHVQWPILGFNVGSVSMDSASTSGYLKSKANMAALTPYTGLIFEYDRFQFGAFVGFDFIAREAGYNWDYRNRPWLGIGLGYAIFSAEGGQQNQRTGSIAASKK